MSSETVSDSSEEKEILEPIQEVNGEETPQEAVSADKEKKEEMVPLWTLQKEREKRKEAELEARWYREREQSSSAHRQKEESEEDLEDAVTKKDLKKVRNEMEQAVYEKLWVKQNPEKAAFVDENIENFLKQRPNLKFAIQSAPNRYEEAFELMDKLTPKQKTIMKSGIPKREGPGSPSGVPKAASMNQNVELSSMTDDEFNAWRKTQRKR